MERTSIHIGGMPITTDESDDVVNALRAVRSSTSAACRSNEVPTFRADQPPYGEAGDSGNTREGTAYTARGTAELRFVLIAARRGLLLCEVGRRHGRRHPVLAFRRPAQ